MSSVGPPSPTIPLQSPPFRRFPDASDSSQSNQVDTGEGRRVFGGDRREREGWDLAPFGGAQSHHPVQPFASKTLPSEGFLTPLTLPNRTRLIQEKTEEPFVELLSGEAVETIVETLDDSIQITPIFTKVY